MTAVPYAGSSAEIMWVADTAMPTWVSQQHKSPAAGRPFTLPAPRHALYCAAMGPWPRPV